MADYAGSYRLYLGMTRDFLDWIVVQAMDLATVDDRVGREIWITSHQLGDEVIDLCPNGDGCTWARFLDVNDSNRTYVVSIRL